MKMINFYSKWLFTLGSVLVCFELVASLLSAYIIFSIKSGPSIPFECIQSQESTTALTRLVLKLTTLIKQTVIIIGFSLLCGQSRGA